MRRCFSYCDLASAQQAPTDTLLCSGSSDSADSYEDLQPIKRSRSDQSLSATAQLAAAAAAAAEAAARGSNGSLEHGLAVNQYAEGYFHNTPGLHSNPYSFGQLSKAQRFPSLPVVLSDVGSSCNSLLSLDSDTARSSGSQSHSQLLELLGSPAAVAATAAAAAGAASGSPAALTAAGVSLSPGDLALLRTSVTGSNKRSAGGLCKLNNSNSAVSLTQAQCNAYADLERTASDASVGSAGGYLASLQQLVPPLPPYSPPPLFSPGPPLLLGQGSGALGVALGFGTLKGGSILLQKQAGFQPPVLPAGLQGGAALASSPGYVRGVVSVGSVGSVDSITSVEAGEHLIRFGGYGFCSPISTAAAVAATEATAAVNERTSPSAAAAATATEIAMAEGTRGRAPVEGPSREQRQQQQEQQESIGPFAAVLSSPSASAVSGAGSSNPSPLPPPAPSRSGLPRPGSTNSLAARFAGAVGTTAATSSTTAAGEAADSSSSSSSRQLLPAEIQQQQQQQHGVHLHLESVSSALESPSVEVQSMGSMLGTEGEQWLVLEGSSGVIGVSPTNSSSKLDAARMALGILPGSTADGSSSGVDSATQVSAASQAAGAAAAAGQAVTITAAVQGAQGAAAAGNVFKARPVGTPSSVATTGATTTSAALPAPSSSAFGFGVGSANTASRMGFYNAAGGAAAAGAAAAKAAFSPQQQQQQPGSVPSTAGVTAAFAGVCSSRAGFTGNQGHSQWPQVSAFAAQAGSAAAAAAAGGEVAAVHSAAEGQDVWQSAPLPNRPNDGASSAAGNWSHSGSHYYQQRLQRAGAGQPQQPVLRDASSYPWSFQRRPASFDCARPSTRRRGSLELNMPWRSRLDAVIAQVEAEPLDSSTPPAASPQSDRSSATGTAGGSAAPVSREGSGTLMLEQMDPFSIEARDPFGADAMASALVANPPGLQQHKLPHLHHHHHHPQHPSGLDLLLPLPEGEGDEQVLELAELGRHRNGSPSSSSSSRGSGTREQQFLNRSSSESQSSISSGGSSSSSGASVAADHGLPGSTNIGGYIGVCDALGSAVPGVEDSYGLEVDGAMVLQSVASSEAVSPGAADSAGSGRSLQQGHYHSKHHQGHAGRHGLSYAQEQEIARMGNAQVDTRLRHAAGGQQQHQVEQRHQQQQQQQQLQVGQAWQGIVEGAAATQQQQQQQQQHHRVHRHIDQQVVVVVEVDEEEEEDEEEEAYLKQLTGGNGRFYTSSAADAAGDATSAIGPLIPESLINLQPASSIGSNISSISSRGGNSGFYNRSGAGTSSSGAAYELFVRLNRARQTLDFAQRQAQAFAELDKAELGVWEALDLLNTLREYEAVLLANASNSARSSASGGQGDASGGAAELQQSGLYGAPLLSQGSLTEQPLTPEMPFKEHALQVAELCRLSFPDKPWMALVGLLHGLGKLLAHPQWGSQPQWAVTGESYPVGARFAPQINHSEFFSANPDRRRRTLSTALGIYTAGCGLRNVYMSWGAPEYLYMALVLNQTELPEEALFMIRYQRCTAITKPGGAYRHLMSDSDKALLPLLAAFQSLVAYRRVQLPPEALKGQQLIDYYNQLIASYLGEEKLFW